MNVSSKKKSIPEEVILGKREGCLDTARFVAPLARAL